MTFTAGQVFTFVIAVVGLVLTIFRLFLFHRSWGFSLAKKFIDLESNLWAKYKE